MIPCNNPTQNVTNFAHIFALDENQFCIVSRNYFTNILYLIQEKNIVLYAESWMSASSTVLKNFLTTHVHSYFVKDCLKTLPTGTLQNLLPPLPNLFSTTPHKQPLPQRKAGLQRRVELPREEQAAGGQPWYHSAVSQEPSGFRVGQRSPADRWTPFSSLDDFQKF